VNIGFMIFALGAYRTRNGQKLRKVKRYVVVGLLLEVGAMVVEGVYGSVAAVGMVLWDLGMFVGVFVKCGRLIVLVEERDAVKRDGGGEVEVSMGKF